MRNLLTGVMVTVGVMVVLIVANVFCNMKGIQLDSVVLGSTVSVCAMLIYSGLTKKKRMHNVIENGW